MVLNPTVKPKIVTAGLVSTSTVVLIGLALFLLAVPAAQLPSLSKVIVGGILVAATLLIGGLWWKRVHRRNAWLIVAAERWKSFEKAKWVSGTTTEVTLLSVDAVQPTGSWVTVKWNRFNHVQQGWVEALPEPLWPGSVLLITPDPAQVMPGNPWPEPYVIRASDCLAWAPSDGRPNAASAVSQHPDGPVKRSG